MKKKISVFVNRSIHSWLSAPCPERCSHWWWWWWWNKKKKVYQQRKQKHILLFRFYPQTQRITNQMKFMYKESQIFTSRAYSIENVYSLLSSRGHLLIYCPSFNKYPFAYRHFSYSWKKDLQVLMGWLRLRRKCHVVLLFADDFNSRKSGI